MTTTDKSPVVRETCSYHRGRALVVQLLPTVVRIRPKGLRTWYEVSYQQIFNRGANNAAIEELARRKEARRARKGTK